MAKAHVVPRFHQRNFGVNKKQIARFDQKTGEKLIVSIESTCAEEDYFSFDEESLANLPWYMKGIHKDIIEHSLRDHIEGPISSIIKTLITEKTLGALSKNDILMLLEWLAWIFIASPYSLALDSVLRITNQYKNLDYSKLSRTERLKIFFDLHAKITPVFQKRGWLLQLIDPKHGRLISGDRPVVIGGKSLEEHPDVTIQTIIFPISPEMALVGNNTDIWGYASKPLESLATTPLIINILILDQSQRFVFGASMDDLNGLFKQLEKESVKSTEPSLSNYDQK